MSDSSGIGASRLGLGGALTPGLGGGGSLKVKEPLWAMFLFAVAPLIRVESMPPGKAISAPIFIV